MKTSNVVALSLGLLAASFLWQYYLKPKYDIKRGHQATEEALLQADIAALEEATAAIEGEVVFKTSDSPVTEMQILEEPAIPGVADDGSSTKDDVLNTRSGQLEDFAFESSANKPRDLYQIAADGDKRKETKIRMESDAVIVHPTILTPDAAPVADTAQPKDERDRFTMVLIPVKYKIVKTNKEYNAVKKQNIGKYPKVNFAKQMAVVLDAGDNLSASVIGIIKTDDKGDTIKIDYRVNILSAAQKLETMPVVVLPKSNKAVELTQVK